MNDALLRIGTAGWSLPPAVQPLAPQDGSGLQRYAALFNAVEINSSFYRPHRPSTYARWAAATPPGFSFAVKAPKTVTHDRRLVEVDGLLEAFFGQIAPLGEKLGPVLLQLPPSLAFDEVAARFVTAWRDGYGGPTVVEPRHASWFTPEADGLLDRARMARVATDPAVVPPAAEPGGWRGLTYIRLHGSPRMYASSYDGEALDRIQAKLADRPGGTPGWCVFDNTMFGAAAADALALAARWPPVPGSRPAPEPS